MRRRWHQPYPFVLANDTFIILDFLARRYGGRPSDWAEYPLDRVWFDLTAAWKAVQKEQRDVQIAQQRERHRGQRS